MRVSNYILATLKETPKFCETISHQLMLRAGLIRQVSSGLYTWLPTGLRVLRKIENIIREEMNRHGAIEILMPIVQPAQLWKQSGRWTQYGTELLHFKNRNCKDFILSPTYEEMVTKLICQEIQSYKQFPIHIYQIHTKYRDEARPRFGIIRSREFIMKDGYSFHVSQESLQNMYDIMHSVYHIIFSRIGIKFCVVQADPGKIGGILSHEFQAYSTHGEDQVAIPMMSVDCISSNYNYHLIDSDIDITKKIIKIVSNTPMESMRLINAPYINSISELVNQFNIPIQKIVKTIIVRANVKCNYNSCPLIRVIIRADHQLSDKKIITIPEILFPVSIVDISEISIVTKIKLQSNLLGPIDLLSIPLIVDYNVAMMSDFIAGSTINGKYFFGVNWNRDFPLLKVADLYKSENDDMHYSNKINIRSIHNCMEIGHIFQLGEKYSNIIQNNIKMDNKCNLNIKMGCYGIGISRMVAAIVDQNHDKKGILWPDTVAPFKLAILPINMYHSINVKNFVEKIYTQLIPIIGMMDILIDDRKVHPGIMFHDMDLIGVPHILIISESNLYNREVEYKYRRTNIVKKIKLDALIEYLTKKCSSL